MLLSVSGSSDVVCMLQASAGSHVAAVVPTPTPTRTGDHAPNFRSVKLHFVFDLKSVYSPLHCVVMMIKISELALKF